jgi:hypothetical protein
MNSNANVGEAHAELLLDTCLGKENPPGNNHPTYAGVFSVKFTVASSTSKQNQN